jgi:phage major head subunit gpT-like protein
MMITSANIDALRVQFEARLQAGIQTVQPWHSELAMEIPSDAKENLYGMIEDTIEVREWLGEREAQSIKERDYRLTNKRFEMSRKLNRDRIADDNFGLFPTSMEDMGRAAALYPDRQFADILLNNVTCFDGLPFFDPSHVKVNGDTYSNSTNLSLTSDNFETVLAALMSQTNAGGDVIEVGTQFILAVSPAKRATAFRIVESETALTVGGTDAGAAVGNANKGAARAIVIPQLASNSNRWFVFAVGLGIKPFIKQTREPLSMLALDQPDHECVNKRNENEYLATFRAAYGVTLPWLAYASDSDGAMT